MKKSLMVALVLGAAAAPGQNVNPTWELTKDSIDPALTKGKIECVEGVVKLDGSNSFAVPAKALGAQNDYTIEFEVKRASNVKGALLLVANSDATNKTGLGLKYFPPDYNAIKLSVNGYDTVEYRGFLSDKFDKVTLVAKDRKLTLFRNGLILAMTDEVKPSALSLVFGEVLKVPVATYELRNIKIYDTSIFPSGFDKSADQMRYVSGPGYAMQRVTLKDTSLPRILVVGDSISMGYRRFITEHFKDKAYVDYWVGGGWFEYDIKKDDFPALRAWDGVLSNGPYDVVSWNAMTLHMWNGAPGRCSETNYPANMTRVVEHLQKSVPKTKFIWVRCTPWRTTPVEGRPTFDNERNNGIIRLNKLTDDIMIKHGIPEVDLYSLCETKLDTVRAGSQDSVHWNEDVSRQMAAEIIKEIESDNEYMIRGK